LVLLDVSPALFGDPGIPPHAVSVLEQIRARHGEPPAGYVGGSRFSNREHRLPPGNYREYDTHPHVRGKNRGPERLVIDQKSGRAYYTPDHYRTFVAVPP
jgi:ribonuclease T1